MTDRLLPTDGSLLPRLDRLKQVVEQAAELLPAQGPITAFVFLNTLQGLEHLPFDAGMQRGARLFGCQPYLIEERYRKKMASGRIRVEDLLTVVREDLLDQANTPVCSLGTRIELRMAMLQYPLLVGPAEELRWYVAEMDALTRMRPEVTEATRERFLEEARRWAMRDLHNHRVGNPDNSTVERESHEPHGFDDLLQRFDATSIEQWSPTKWESFALQALWRICHAGVQEAQAVSPRPDFVAPIRHRDILREANGVDTDDWVHEVLIRFCAPFVDQGFANWTLPHREQGFFKAFCKLYRQSGGPPNEWQRGLSDELSHIMESGHGALDSLLESLELLGVSEHEWEDFVPASLVALRGWAGLIWQLDVRGDRVALPAPAGSLIEFLAVR